MNNHTYNPKNMNPVRFLFRAIIFLVAIVESTSVQADYYIDGQLTDWGVTPTSDWTPDSSTANYIITADKNTYSAKGYSKSYDVEAMYFDDDSNFFYFVIVTKYAFVTFPPDSAPIPLSNDKSGGDLGIDFDIAATAVENTDIGMDISEHGRVTMKGAPGQSTLGLDYGIRLASIKYGPLGQTLTQPNWVRTRNINFENEGYQGGPWRIEHNWPANTIGLSYVAFGLVGKSYVIEGAIPRRLFPNTTNGGLLGLHISMYCGNDSSNLVASFSPANPTNGLQPLTIEKSLINAHLDAQNRAIIYPGEWIDFGITYRNNNPIPVTEMMLIDALPPELTFIRTGGYSQGEYNSTSHQLTYAKTAVRPGESGIIQLQCQVRPDTPIGTVLFNTATADCYEAEATSATQEMIVQSSPLAPIVLEKSIAAGAGEPNGLQPGWAEAGETITYGLSLTNSNSVILSNILISDILPRELMFVADPNENSTGNYDPNTHVYTLAIPQLAAGETFYTELTAQVLPLTPAYTEVTNRMIASSDQTPSSSAEIGFYIKPIVYQPLNISKRIVAINNEDNSYESPMIEGDDLLTYEIEIDNRSNDHLVQNVLITDTFPDEVVFLEEDNSDNLGTYDPNQHTYTLFYPSLMPGVSEIIHLTVRVQSTVSPETVIVNQVSVTSHETAPNTAIAVAVIKPYADSMQFLKTLAAGGDFIAGDPVAHIKIDDDIVYSLCLFNGNADRIIRNISIVDVLPEEMSFVRATDLGTPSQYDPNAHTFTWTIHQLLPGEGYCLELTTRVKDSTLAGTLVINQAQFSSNQTTPITSEVLAVVNPAHFESANLTKRISAINLANRLSLYPAIDPGAMLTYDISFNNDSNTYSIIDLTLTDPLPAEVSFIEDLSVGQPGHYNSSSHSYTWEASELLPGEEVHLNLLVKVDDDVTPESTISNEVTLSAQNMDSESALSKATVRPPLAANLTTTPLIVGRRGANRSQQLTAYIEMPAGILRTDIADGSITLSPGLIPAITQETYVENSKTILRAIFNVAALMDATALNGLTPITVKGRLHSGRQFQSESQILIVEERPL